MGAAKHFRLLGTPEEERAWAAVAYLTSSHRWVHIDTVGDFLRMRQVEATAVKFDSHDPATRYALRPGVTRWPKGWEDPILASALSSAVDHRTVDHVCHGGENYFRARAATDHHPWSYENPSVPAPPGGYQLHLPRFADFPDPT